MTMIEAPESKLARAAAHLTVSEDDPGYTRERWYIARDAVLAAFEISGEQLGALWQPIATAPKDGAIILLTSTDPSWKYPFPAKWDALQDRWVFADEPLNDIWAVSDLVTHWQPCTTPNESTPHHG